MTIESARTCKVTLNNFTKCTNGLEFEKLVRETGSLNEHFGEGVTNRRQGGGQVRYNGRLGICEQGVITQDESIHEEVCCHPLRIFVDEYEHPAQYPTLPVVKDNFSG
jgi:hypothetical protein